MSVRVTTQHNDNERTGANLQETVLNTANVNVTGFGKVFEFEVEDGHIYGQPLYLPDVPIPMAGIRNVVYVATMQNIVYAFDADDRPGLKPLWKVILGPSVALPDDAIGGGRGYHDIQREVGILSTPVISTSNNAIYVVSFSKDSAGFHHKLHALDLSTGVELFGGPRVIEASVPGTGAGSVNGEITFQSHLQNQRPALLLSRDIVYIAFASYGDFGDYHGWVLGYDAASLAPLPRAANLTPHTRAAGIWQAGQGPAADSDGNIYVMSGNGDFNERSLGGKRTFEESLLGAPAAADLGGARLALAWTANSGSKPIHVAVSSGGQSFQSTVTLTETSIDGPALAFGGATGELYLAWTGTDRRHSINILPSPDGISFGSKITLPQRSAHGPSLAWGNGRLFLAWIDDREDKQLSVMSSPDGVIWSAKTTLAERSKAAPALFFHSGTLYLSWAGTDNQLNVMESTDGVTFGNKKTFPQSSSFAPVLSHDGEFRMMWTGLGRPRDRALHLMSGSTPQTAAETQTYSDRGAAAPALVSFNGSLYVLWAGDETLRRLNIAEVTNTPSLGDCIVKLGPDLSIADWFTPWNTHDLNDADTDLGSGGALLLPGTRMLAGGGKEGKLYLLDRDNLGGFCSPCTAASGETRIVQAFQATADVTDRTVPRAIERFHHIHGSPVYWNSPDHGPVIYIWGEADRARAYAFDGTRFDPVPVHMSAASVVTPKKSMPGAMLSLSADGNRSGSGILWATHPTAEDANHGIVAGTLRALDASDLSRELWNSDQALGGRDKLGMIAKFSAPTVANGRVYVATFSGKVMVYGRL